MKRILLLISLLLLNCAWFSPRTQSGLTASVDVLPASTDAMNVGVSNNRWKNGFVSYLRIAEKSISTSNDFSDITSYGTLYVSLDHKLYFRTASGGMNAVATTN